MSTGAVSPKSVAGQSLDELPPHPTPEELNHWYLKNAYHDLWDSMERVDNKAVQFLNLPMNEVATYKCEFCVCIRGDAQL